LLPRRARSPPAERSRLRPADHTFFPSLISAPFEHGLAIAFYFAIAACLVAALASLLRGAKYVHGGDPAPVTRAANARQILATSQIPAGPAVRSR
jgi:hypothetical protein